MLVICWSSVAPAESQPGVIVLQNGRVLSGAWQRQAGGYLLRQPGGEALLPEESVRVVAKDLREAYELQRRRLTNPAPEDHVMLAEWCLSQNLRDEAYAELKDALYLNPEHGAARRLLIRWSRMHPEKSAGYSQPKTYRDLTPRDDDPQIESLAGFSRKTAEQFTTRIQPILQHNCGNGRCHGSATTTEFRLERAYGGGAVYRRTAERNLATVLRFVDSAEPSKSPLLTEPQGNHGGSRLGIFSGLRGGDQSAELRQWVHDAVTEMQSRSIGLAARPVSRSDDGKTGQSNAPTPVPAMDELPATTPEQATELEKAAIIQQILRQQLPDAFDPNEFNRRFGNGSSGTKFQ